MSASVRPLFRKSSSCVLLLLILALSTSALAEDRAPAEYHSRFIGIQFYHDMTYLLGQSDFYMVVGGLGLAPTVLGSSFVHEDPEFTELWGNSQFADNMFEAGEIIGDGLFPVSLSAVSWGAGRLVGSDRIADFGTDLIRAQVVNGILTGTMKVGINRTRPDGSAYSYPSGHTSSTFATAGVIYKHFGKAWGIPAFAVATYVGFSRLQENKHYLSDVIAGGILGSYVSLKLSKHDTRGGSLNIFPTLIGNDPGVGFSMRF